MAEKRIKGITIEIGGDTKKLGDALKGVNRQISDINVELKDLNKALKLDPKNTELLTQKQTLLKEQIKATTDRLNTLKEAQRQMAENGIDETNEDFRALSIEISRCESNLKDYNEELKKTKGFDLSQLNDSLSGVRETTEKLVKSMVKVGTAIGGALTALGVSSIKSYANYEQLVGGVEKIFGDSSKQLIDYANNAYKTAGVSANQYMETATNFSASLIRGLNGDTKKATELTDRAIRDMADNANTFGSSMDEVMNVYKALSKEQYTTLDNLRLGYSGTKKGMQELIRDASKYKDIQKDLGVTVDESSLSFDNIINAISVMQSHLNISGTTAKEAEHTISGSINQMKASWGNLLNSISDDNADMSKSVDNFVDSVITAGKNIVPRLKVAFEGIKKLFNSLVREVFPKLKREIPQLAPIINIFEWFIDHKNLVITAVKAIIGVFAVTKIVEFATKMQDVFNKVTTFAKSGVVGGLTVAITGIVTVATVLTDIFSNLDGETKKLREEQERHIDVLNEQKNSWKELEDARNEAIAKGMGELDYYDNLYKELQSITDENGKVKEGYEARAKFIVDQLNGALDTEIEMNDNVIKSYDKVGDAIDKIMKKKRAEVIMDAQNSQYQEAITKKQEAYDNLKGLDEDYLYWQSKYNEELSKGYSADNEVLINWYKTKMDSSKQAYDEQEDLYNGYLHTIAQYEQNLQYIHDENYDKIDTRTYQSVKNYQSASDAQRAQLEDDIKHTEAELKYYKDLYAKSGDDIYKKKIEDDERLLEAQKTDLQKYISVFESKQPSIYEVGANFGQGLLNGINSKKGSIYTALSNMGLTMIDKIKKVLKINSPSKATEEIGDFLIEGLSLGIEENEKALLNQVDELGNSVIGGLMSDAQMAMRGLNGSMKTSLNPTINPSVAYDLNYQLMANAMKEALQEVDVELDDRQVGKFVNKVVSEEVFN